MTKKIIVLLALLFLGVFSFAGDYKHYGFSVKCARCVELHQKDPGLSINIAWRTCNYKKVGDKVYAEYRCQGGHKYLAEIF